MKAGKKFSAKAPKSAHKPTKHSSVHKKAEEPLKIAKSTATPLAPPPKAIGGNQLKFAKGKRPKEFSSDRGIFGMK